MNLRVLHPSRSLRRVGSYDLTLQTFLSWVSLAFLGSLFRGGPCFSCSGRSSDRLLGFLPLVGRPKNAALQKKRGTLSGVPLSLFSAIPLRTQRLCVIFFSSFSLLSVSSVVNLFS